MWKVYKERIETEKELKHELTEEDRGVFRVILLRAIDRAREEAFYELHKMYSRNETKINPNVPTSDKIDQLSFKSPKEIIFTYCEIYIDIYQKFHQNLPATFIKDMKNFFEIRGLLYNFEHNEEEDKIEIYPIASDKMRERHTEAKSMLLERGWNQEAILISKSVSQFKKGESSYSSSLKSLYKALEIALKHTLLEISKKSSKELDKKTISQVLGFLQKESFFEGPEGDYIRHVSESINKLGAFIGGKRKEEDHSGNIKGYQVLFCLYGVDNCICYLINQLKNKRRS